MRLDLIVLVDASSEVGEANFQYEVDFTDNLISKFTISEDDTHAGVIDYSDKARPLVEMSTDGTSPTQIMKELYSLRTDYRRGKRDLKSALTEAQQMFDWSGRSDVVRALVILTSGPDVNTVESLEQPLKQLKEKSTKIIPVNIGRNVSLVELKKIAKTPFHIKNVTEFANLPAAIPDVVKLIVGPGMFLTGIFISKTISNVLHIRNRCFGSGNCFKQ